MNQVPPSVRKTAFSCPHCEALAHQSWYSLHVKELQDNGTPAIFTEAGLELYLESIEDINERERRRKIMKKLIRGDPALEYQVHYTGTTSLYNVSISVCFNCGNISVWIYDRIVYPRTGKGPPPNADLPPDIRQDYDEARNILDFSPRGAAALLRLAIQKLCKELGESGADLNTDIGELVKKGLDLHIQQALDVVRVTGNEAVHPGQIDLTDDYDAAETLFSLVNVIAEKMISVPKHIDDLYKTLPENKRKQIERRDAQVRQEDT